MNISKLLNFFKSNGHPGRFLTIAFAVLVIGTIATVPNTAFAGKICGGGDTVDSAGNSSKAESVSTAIDLGCLGKGNPIMDMIFAFVRFLSAGVGLVIVGSMVYGGIQYSVSRGDPAATAKAVGRLRSNVIALLLFIFGYAILNYIVPGAFLK